jgi:hypothetical protein
VVFQANQNDQQQSWLFRQLDGSREENADKARRIAELEERVQQLEAELKAERQKQFKAARPEEAPPSQDVSEENQENQPKKRGAPVGHPGWFRPTPTHIDRTIDVPAPACCPHCGAAVVARPDLAPYEHIQEDLIDGQPTVTCYRHVEGLCTNPECGRSARQPGEGEILLARIGPQMRARGLFLRFHIGLSHRKVVGAVAGLDCLSFTPAALLGFEKKAAQTARPLAYDVAKKLRACEVNHADETHYSIDGQHAQVWFHGNEHLAHFYICGTRSGKISRKILGVDYAGALVTDCYAGYDRHATKIKQKCLEHLKRTAKDWLKVTPDKATASRQFFADVMAWTKRGCRWHRRWKADSGPEKEVEAAWLREEQARLEGVALDSKKAQTLQGRIRRYSKEWLTFLDHPHRVADEQPGRTGDPLPGRVAEGDLWQPHAGRGPAAGGDAHRDSNGQAAGAEHYPVLGGVVYADAQRGGAGDVRPLLSRARRSRLRRQASRGRTRGRRRSLAGGTAPVETRRPAALAQPSP